MKHSWLLPFIVFLLHFTASPAAAARMELVAGAGKPGYSGDGGAATNAAINNPYGVVLGPDGALFVCEIGNHVIRKISKEGLIRTVAGTGKSGYSGDGGPASKAELNEPYEIRIAANGGLYFVEMKNHLVRRVDAKTGMIHTVSGSGKSGFGGDGSRAKNASFNQPHSLQLDRAGNIFICDIGNHRVRKIDAGSGLISTFSGTGERRRLSKVTPINQAPLNGPRALDFDAAGNIWLALREGNAIYKMDLAVNKITHIAGTGASGFSGNGGPAESATLSGPKGISVGPGGKVYFADTESHSIRMIDPATGKLELIIGTGKVGSRFDFDPLKCELNRPHGVYAHTDGSIYVGDSENHRVLRLVP